MIAVLVDELVRELITHNAIWYENASQLLTLPETIPND